MVRQDQHRGSVIGELSDLNYPTTAEPISAAPMYTVVEFSTTRDVDLSCTASYAAKSGQPANVIRPKLQGELGNGEKTLTGYALR